MKSLTILAQKVLQDMGDRVGTSTHRDWLTISKRVENEGYSFLAITLAQFCKDFERSLDRGWVGHDLFTHFAFSGSCPRFLGGFFDLIFDRGTGLLLDNISFDAVAAIRQFSGMWSKTEIECTQVRIDRAFEDYISSEITVREYDSRRTESDLSDFRRISHMLFRDLFTSVDSSVYNGTLIPKHGSGSTADGTLGNKKYYHSTWTDRLEHMFPARENLASSYSLSFERDLQWLTPEQEPPVRVITVPKTLKTPRIIAMEPVHMQYVQQALLEAIVDASKRDNLLSRMITFDDQKPNQVMAYTSSLDGSLATLDLSAASDLVSNQLVMEMTKPWPNLYEAVQACRSQVADVNGTRVPLAKFASMGSALCFPFETFVFMTLIIMGAERASNHQFTRNDIRRISSLVRAYGDDLIVPVGIVHEVVGLLEGFGLKVNQGKSFWTGKFRESCGKEFYSGHDVSIVKVRNELPTRPTHVEELVSAVSFRNQAYSLGMIRTVEFMDTLVEKLIPFPHVHPGSPVLGKHSWDEHYDVHHMCPRLQRPLVKGVVVKSILPLDEVDSGAALLKFFLKRGDKPLERGHLRRAGRPSTVKLKAGYYPSSAPGPYTFGMSSTK